MNIIIPLGGKGERFHKAGYKFPKPLIPVFDKPLLFYVLDNLDIQPDDKVFIIYYNLDAYNFENVIHNKYNNSGINITCIKIHHQTHGAAETLLLGLDTIKQQSPYKQCLILDCDTFYTQNILEIYRNIINDIQQLDTVKQLATATTVGYVYYTHNTESDAKYSYITFKGDNNVVYNRVSTVCNYPIITGIKEKIKISDNANTGIYCFNNIDDLAMGCKYIIEHKIHFNGEYYTSCVIDYIICQHPQHNFRAIMLDPNYVFNLGTPAQLNTYITNTHTFLFDLDGTLVISDDIYYDIWSQILAQYNIELSPDKFKKYIQGNSDETVLSALKFDTQSHSTDLLQTISSTKDTLFLDNIDKIQIIPGVLDFLKLIKKHGHKLGIVTNCNRPVAESILQYIGINHIIDVLIIGNECAKSKPYPDPYIAAIQYFNTTNTKTIIFEDSKTGLQSAKTTNPKCLVGITTIYPYNELLECGVNIAIPNYLELALDTKLAQDTVLSQDTKLEKDTVLSLDTLLAYNDNNLRVLANNIQNSLAYLNIHNIDILQNKLKGGFISDVLHVNITTLDTVDTVDTVTCHKSHSTVIKLENKNTTFLSQMANNLGLYAREYYFYESLSRYIPIKIPHYYGLIKDSNLNNVGILLENLQTKGYKLNLDLNTERVEVSLKVIECLAELHAKFWNKPLSTNFKDLKKHNDPMFNPTWTEFITSKWTQFQYKWRGIISNTQIAQLDNIVQNFTAIQSRLSTGNLTLCHGDVKSANLFYKPITDGKLGYEPYFIDWQYVSIGKGVQDLIFFMIESFDIDTINKYKNLFINYYYVKLLEFGITDYTFDEYMLDICDAASYFPVFVAMWFGTLNEDELIDKHFPRNFILRLVNML